MSAAEDRLLSHLASQAGLVLRNVRLTAELRATIDDLTAYAQASQATVALSGHDGHLGFTVKDDGIGFDAGHTHQGTGLQGMADRLAALGGSLQLHSSPGEGTTVSGTLPVAALAPDRRYRR